MGTINKCSRDDVECDAGVREAGAGEGNGDDDRNSPAACEIVTVITPPGLHRSDEVIPCGRECGLRCLYQSEE